MSDMFTFDAWRGYLEFDAEQVAIRRRVEAISVGLLENLWRAGVQPTVGAVIKFCESPGPILCTECQTPVCKGSALCAVHLRLIRDELIGKANARIRDGGRRSRRGDLKRPAGVSDSVTIAVKERSKREA